MRAKMDVPLGEAIVTPSALVELVRVIVQSLVDGNYSVIGTRTRGVRLSVQEIRSAINDYGRTLIMPPESEFVRGLDVYPVQSSCGGEVSDRGVWSVVCNLWTREEGRSDLSLECTVIERGESVFDIEIDDIHVL